MQPSSPISCPSHHRRKFPAARTYAARVFLLRMLTVKNSRKRNAAGFPAPAISPGSSPPAVFPMMTRSRLMDHLRLVALLKLFGLLQEPLYLFFGSRFHLDITDFETDLSPISGNEPNPQSGSNRTRSGAVCKLDDEPQIGGHILCIATRCFYQFNRDPNCEPLGLDRFLNSPEFLLEGFAPQRRIISGADCGYFELKRLHLPSLPTFSG